MLNILLMRDEVATTFSMRFPYTKLFNASIFVDNLSLRCKNGLGKNENEQTGEYHKVRRPNTFE